MNRRLLIAVVAFVTVVGVFGGRPTLRATDARGANLWVDAAGGACARQNNAAAYDDGDACASLGAAWDAARAGDLICVKPGTYDGQTITGDKDSETTIRGCEGGVTVQGRNVADPCPGKDDQAEFQGGALCSNARFLVLEDITIDSLDTHGVSNIGQINGDNSTLRRVSMVGELPSFWVRGAGFTWSHGSFGTAGPAAQRRCNLDGQPMQIDGDGATLEFLHIHSQGSDQTPCPDSANGFHLDVMRFESAAKATIRFNYFEPSEAGSGYLFFTGATSATDTKVVGNYFAKNADGSNFAQINESVGANCPIVWLYNTFSDGHAASGCSEAGSVWIGNAGFYQGCAGKHEKNVWSSTTPAQCANDTILTGAIGLAADGRPKKGSPVIDAADTDACPAVDLDGRKRPSGKACDAGAFEF